jgi:site-specific DNA-methyltransferase (adenine-specific)
MELQCLDNLMFVKTLETNLIDLIYCDILYGTGKDFGDYVDLKPIRAEIENHYIPRILEFKRVLKETGTIWLQMDYRISHWIRIICDDIFGYDNFVNEIVWCYGAGGFDKSKFVNPKHDTILVYSKSSKFTNNCLTDVNGSRLKSWWQIKSIADKSGFFQNDDEHLLYKTQKPVELLQRIVKIATNEFDTVADFYLGSGTTAVVCSELNRNFIGCDINPKSIETTKQRLETIKPINKTFNNNIF